MVVQDFSHLSDPATRITLRDVFKRLRDERVVDGEKKKALNPN